MNFSELENYNQKISQYETRLEYLEFYLGKLENIGLLDNKDLYLSQIKPLVDDAIANLRANFKNKSVKFDNVIKAIKKHCSEIVSVYKETSSFLYRGMKDHSDAIYGSPYVERAPKDSSREYSKIFNQMLKEGGFAARRDNSIFCSGDIAQTEGYGTAYIIFPKNGFDLTYSRNTDDLVLDRSTFHRLFDQEKLLKLYEELVEDKKMAAKINPEWVDSYRLQEKTATGKYGFFGEWYWDEDRNNIIAAAESGKIPKEYIERVDFSTLITPDSVIENFQISDDVKSAILSEKEVFISGSYFGIRAKYEDDIRKALGMES